MHIRRSYLWQCDLPGTLIFVLISGYYCIIRSLLPSCHRSIIQSYCLATISLCHRYHCTQLASYRQKKLKNASSHAYAGEINCCRAVTILNGYVIHMILNGGRIESSTDSIWFFLQRDAYQYIYIYGYISIYIYIYICIASRITTLSYNMFL